MDLVNKIKDFVEKHRMLFPGNRVLLAVSGGPDSVALLHILYDLKKQLEISLEVAHLQHGIRGEEGEEDAQFVAGVAERLGLLCHVKAIDLPQMKRTYGKGSLEEMGRLERYRFFVETAHRYELDAVATAHTIDDQAETFVMRLFRGAGRTGLRGMPPVRYLDDRPDRGSGNVLLIRPLLDATRREVMEFLDQRKLSFRIDRSNAELFYLRNWIRLKLMPELIEKFGAELPARLCAQMEVLRDEEAYLADLTRQQFDRISEGNKLNRNAFLDSNKALRRRMIRLLIEQRRGHLRAIDFDHVEAALSLIAAGPPQGRVALPGGWELAREYGTITFERNTRGVKRQCYSYPFHAGATLNVMEAGMTIESRIRNAPPENLPQNLMEAVFDADLLKGNLFVRNFRNGDRFQPLGMSGHKKVKDLFIANRLPLRTRAVLPLLIMDEEILWIPGVGRSDFAKAGPATKIWLSLKATLSLTSKTLY
jgi:tRNA(Ile)-lysidine synthase